MDGISSSSESVGFSAPAEAPASAPESAPELAQDTPVAQGPTDGFDASGVAAAGAQRAQGDSFEGGAAPVAAAGRPADESAYSRALPAGISPDNYSPDRPGWHDYTRDGVVAPAGMQVTADEMRDYMSRHAVPGQDPSRPVQNGQESTVVDPRGGFWGAVQGGRSLLQGQQDRVRTEVSDDGLTVSNRTLPGHALHDGRIVRTAYQDGEGNWRVRTHGYGNNEGMFPSVNAALNQSQGPEIFRAVDEGMAANIRRHHAN